MLGGPLIFFSLPFWKTARKTTKTARISSACRTPKILGKEGKNAQNRKEFLEKEKGKEKQKGKEKKIRDISDISYFFLLGEGKGESEALGGGAGRFFIENRRRGGGSPRRVGAGVFAGNRGGGGLNFFFSGSKLPPSMGTLKY